jgi:hypothetical protein
MTAEENTHNPQNGRKLLARRETGAYTLVLELSPDETRCFVSCQPTNGSVSIRPRDFLKLLTEAGINKEFILLTAVVEYCISLKTGLTLEKTLVARSYEPQPGVDGSVVISVSTTTDGAHYTFDEQGKIDYRSRHAIANVASGQRVGTVNPPTAGPPGCTVTGIAIPPILGKPCEFIVGSGIHLEEAGEAIIVDAEGRLLFDGKTLSVTDELVVSNDVNYAVGHIEFSGFVHVKGDVLDEFNIKAAKGLQVDGVVGACQLVAGGDVKLVSMFGKGTGTIRCTGDLQANILSGVTVECHGDVKVSGEIRDSIIKALGTITAKIICGGENVALMGLEAKTIGAKCGTPSIIRAGVNFFDPARLRTLHNQLHTIEEKMQKIQESVTALSQHLEKTAVESVGIHLKARKKELRELTVTREILEEELRFFQLEQEQMPNAKINITGTIHEGVTLNLEHIENTVAKEIIGSLTIIKNPTDATLLQLPLSPLRIPAAVLAGEILAGRRKQEV